MSRAHPLVCCVQAIFIFALQDARAAPVLEVERAHDTFAVRIEIPVAVDVATAWQVLTDYDHLAEFVPDMRSSRMQRGEGGRLLLEQQGEAKFLFFSSRIDVTLEVEESPPVRLQFKAVRGNMKIMQGEWRVSATAAGIDLIYEAQLEPDFWVPPLIGSVIMRRDVARQVDGVVQEMLRRHAAAHGAGGAGGEVRAP
jgi:hypothetical protein